jgi:uncharacterized membrane protein YfcA
MEWIGYAVAILVGISLGMIGGGGSILTIPLLVYFFGIEPVPATAYSLFIVGTASLVSVASKYRNGLVNNRVAWIFGVPAIGAIYLTRALLLPAIPDTIAVIGNLIVTRSKFLMLLFSMLMIVAAVSMIKKSEWTTQSHQINYILILLLGLGTGIVTGLLGAGGGFIIIPALVLFAKLDMKKAVGTSLAIIAINSMAGFISSIGQYTLNWKLLLTITGLSIAGAFAGDRLSRMIEGQKLKKGFGWFVLGISICILLVELTDHKF